MIPRARNLQSLSPRLSGNTIDGFHPGVLLFAICLPELIRLTIRTRKNHRFHDFIT